VRFLKPGNILVNLRWTLVGILTANNDDLKTLKPLAVVVVVAVEVLVVVVVVVAYVDTYNLG